MAPPQDDVPNVNLSAATEAAEQELLTANVTVVSPYEPDERVEERRVALRGLVPGIVAIVAGGTGIFLASQVQVVKNTPLGPPFWPSMISWGMLLFGVVLLAIYFIRGLRWGDVPDSVTGWGISRLLLSMVVLVGYLSLWSNVPFWLSTAVTLFVLVFIYGARGWKPLTFFPIGITALLHFLFVVALKVPL